MERNPVLYVEDEKDDIFLMQIAFKQAGICSPLQPVMDGKEAMAYLEGKGAFADRTQYPLPAVMLLDLNLPLIPGFEVLKWVRQRLEFESLPIVIFSSSGRAEDRETARQLGANDYMLKPASGLQFVDFAREFQRRWLTARN